MTTEELMALLGQDGHEEYIEFDRVENKRHPRRDVHAFLLLHELLPGDSCMVSGAAHDKIWLDASVDDLAAVATNDQLIELIRCGLIYDSDAGCLAMFV